MPDQIFTAGPLPAPLVYTVPGTGEVVPLACQALFDGSGASGSFVPALLFTSQAGHVIARVPTSTIVAAGASAEVSWFPGGEPVGGAGASVVAWAYIAGDGTITTVAGNPATGNPTLLPWGQFNFTEDGSGTFFFDPLAPTYLQCHASPQPGYFIVYANFSHDNSTPSALTFGDVRGDIQTEAPTGSGPQLTGVKTVQSSNIGDPNDPSTEFGWVLSAWFASRGDTTPIGFQVLVQNFNAAAANLNAAAANFSVALVAS